LKPAVDCITARESGLRCAPYGLRKLIFFVLVDGWSLVAGSLVQSYGPG